MSGPTPTVTRSDRMLRAFRALVAAETPRLTFLAAYDYVVQSSSAGTCDMTPADATLGLPSLQGIPMRLSTVTATPGANQHVLMIFVNGDPTRPVVINSDPVPVSTTIDAGSMTIGPSSGSIAMGPLPVPLAHATPLTAGLGAISTAFAAISVYAAAIKSVADPSNAATPALTAAMTAVSSAVGTANAAIPTTVVKGT